MEEIFHDVKMAVDEAEQYDADGNLASNNDGLNTGDHSDVVYSHDDL